MAIAVDATSSGSGTTTATVSHTIGGTNTLLCVSVSMGTSKTISSMQYNGVNMTQIASQNFNSGADTLYAYYLINPTTGTHNIVATANGSTGVGVAAVSYKNVIQTSSLDAQNTGGSDTGSSDTTILTTVTDNCWGVIFASGISGVTPGAGTGVTSRASTNPVFIGDSNGVIHPAGAYSMTVTKTSGNPVRTIVAGFKPNDYSFTVTDTVSSSEPLQTKGITKATITDTVSSSETTTSKYGIINKTKHSVSVTNKIKS